MPNDVTMPKLSDTMEEGKILRWLKQPGDHVSVGEVLAEVETDKADMELEAEEEGTLAELVVEEGGSAAVGQVIARLVAPSVAASGDGAGATSTEPAPQVERSVGPGREPARHQGAPRDAQGREDPPRVIGSGPAGRVVRRDLEPTRRESDRPPPAPVAARHPAGARRLPAPGRVEELSRIRRTVARRMAESKRDVPHFYMTAEAEMSECARLKSALAEARPDAPAVSFTHILLRAAAVALVEHPRVNARYVAEDSVEFSDGVHLGIAVALEGGLIVPVLHDCASKDVFAIAAEVRALVERVRSGKAQGDDLSGGTFTVSNLGMFPIEEFAAVINPPQAAVLATGAVRERPIARGGRVVAAPTMRMTLSSDHRVIDGAEAAGFLRTLKEILENPLRLVL